MVCLRVPFLMGVLFAVALFVSAAPAPDSAGTVPEPGPGLTYGGIPYGSVSGNVAEYFRHYSPSGGRSLNYPADHRGNSVDYAPIEQYL